MTLRTKQCRLFDMKNVFALICVLWLTSQVHTSQADNHPGPAESLIWDLNRIVELEQQSGWKIDHYEYESMLSSALYSMCRCPNNDRLSALAILDQRVKALGGNPEEELEKVPLPNQNPDLMMTQWRVRTLLALAIENQDKCPFWITENSNYRGLHSEAGRLSYQVEGGGALVARSEAETFRAGGGGGGRVSIGYGFMQQWDVRVGLDIGGSAITGREGEADDIAVDGYMALPLTLRHVGALYRQEVELAPIQIGVPGLDKLRYGIRFGGLIGISYLRVRRILPWVGLGIYGEYAFAREELPAVWTFRAGARFGFSWSAGHN